MIKHLTFEELTKLNELTKFDFVFAFTIQWYDGYGNFQSRSYALPVKELLNKTPTIDVSRQNRMISSLELFGEDSIYVIISSQDENGSYNPYVCTAKALLNFLKELNKESV